MGIVVDHFVDPPYGHRPANMGQPCNYRYVWKALKINNIITFKQPPDSKNHMNYDVSVCAELQKRRMEEHLVEFRTHRRSAPPPSPPPLLLR